MPYNKEIVGKICGKICGIAISKRKVWGEIESIQDGYWVHKDTGVKTYFDLTDPSIENGIMGYPSWRFDCSEVQFPSGVTGLGGYCFAECTSLASITLPESVTSLGGYCFAECTSLASINIPEGVTILEEGIFLNCSSLTSITLPESLTGLGAGCFAGCSSLTSITLPESVVSLEEGCFAECTSLTLATVLPTIPPTLGEFAFYGVHTSFNIKVRSPYVDAYKTATNWNQYSSKISAI